MDMSDDDVVVAGRRVIALGESIDVVLAMVRQASSSSIAQIARLRAITGLGLTDAQKVMFSDCALPHIGQREIGLIHSFPTLTGEYASTIRSLYVAALISNGPWLTAIPSRAAPHDESGVYYWQREKPGLVDAPGFGFFSGTGFDAFRAEMRAVPDTPPRFAVVTDTPHVFTCRFAVAGY
ncbi:hypothetical protein [Nonomuraea sp. NPDC049695]|uniref:hypothetical protein n=1 Tax=Nonomuraea sp. NPDC049695 TaxID=3154734 RepID=UPI00343B07DB